MKHQAKEVLKAGTAHPCVRCGGIDKESNNDVFCRHCGKALISLLNE